MASLFYLFPFAYQITAFGRCLLSFCGGRRGFFQRALFIDSPGSIRGAGDLWPAVRLPHAPGRRTRKLAKDAPVDIDENSSKPDIALLAQRYSTRRRDLNFNAGTEGGKCIELAKPCVVRERVRICM